MPVPRNNYQLQAGNIAPTLTVGDLLDALEQLPRDAAVVVLSPEYGGFGSEMPYGIATVEDTLMPRMERIIPAAECEDEDTGEVTTQEAETQVWPAWRGVILQCR